MDIVLSATLIFGDGDLWDGAITHAKWCTLFIYMTTIIYSGLF